MLEKACALQSRTPTLCERECIRFYLRNEFALRERAPTISKRKRLHFAKENDHARRKRTPTPCERERLSFARERLDARDGAAQDQGMDVGGALVGVDRLEVHHVSNDVVVLNDAVACVTRSHKTETQIEILIDTYHKNLWLRSIYNYTSKRVHAHHDTVHAYALTC